MSLSMRRYQRPHRMKKKASRPPPRKESYVLPFYLRFIEQDGKRNPSRWRSLWFLAWHGAAEQLRSKRRKLIACISAFFRIAFYYVKETGLFLVHL